MISKLPINLEDLLRQRKVEGDRIEYKKGWNPDMAMTVKKILATDQNSASRGKTGWRPFNEQWSTGFRYGATMTAS